MTAYGPLSARFYDADKPHAPAAELAFYVAALPRAAGGVLEPMCGSGRLLVPLIDAGFGEVINVLEGFEGSLDEAHHRGEINGWRKEGLPWEQT